MKNFTSEHKGKIAIVHSNVDKLDSTNAPELKSLFIHLNNGYLLISIITYQKKFELSNNQNLSKFWLFDLIFHLIENFNI